MGNYSLKQQYWRRKKYFLQLAFRTIKKYYVNLFKFWWTKTILGRKSLWKKTAN